MIKDVCERRWRGFEVEIYSLAREPPLSHRIVAKAKRSLSATVIVALHVRLNWKE